MPSALRLIYILFYTKSVYMLTNSLLVQLKHRFTLIASYNSPVNFVSTLWTKIAGFLILNPFFSTDFSSIWDSSQNYLFSNSHRKIFDILTGEFVALMTSGISFFFRTISDLTLLAMHKQIIG